jgi:hypothetical protein
MVFTEFRTDPKAVERVAGFVDKSIWVSRVQNSWRGQQRGLSGEK